MKNNRISLVQKIFFKYLEYFQNLVNDWNLQFELGFLKYKNKTSDGMESNVIDLDGIHLFIVYRRLVRFNFFS